MKLKGEKIHLRAVEPADVDAIFLFENAPEAMPVALNSAPVSRQQVWQYVNGYEGDIFREGELRMMIVRNDTGATVGCIDIADFNAYDRRGFVGIYISEDCRRKGYAAEALALLCAYASEVLGMHQLLALIAAENGASLSLFKSAGFKTCGRLRSWLRQGKSYTDAIICQLLF